MTTTTWCAWSRVERNVGDHDEKTAPGGRRLSRAALLVRERMDEAAKARERAANPGHVFETPGLGEGDRVVDGVSDTGGEDYLFDEELLARVSTLDKRTAMRAMRALGAREYERCKQDALYWALPWRHPAMPYVYTYDKRPLDACRLCREASDREPDNLVLRDRAEWVMYPDIYETHLRHTHEMRGLTKAELHSYFVRMATARPMPAKPYIEPLLGLLNGPERYVAVAKSRDVMGTWCCIVSLCHSLFFADGWEGVAQSQKAPKTWELLGRVKEMHRLMPAFLRRHRLDVTKGQDKSGTAIVEDMGNVLYGVGAGPDQVRQYHPALYFQDESAFQENAAEAYAAIQPAIRGGGKVWLLSSAAPGFFQTIVEDRSQG